MRFPNPMLLLLAILSLSLTACVAAPISSPAIVNACDSVVLPPRLADGPRAQLAAELDTAPAAAEWPQVLTDAARVERDLRACQGVKS
jgi:hypothetical protein